MTPTRRRTWILPTVAIAVVIALGLGVAALLGAFTATPDQQYLHAVHADTGLGTLPDVELLDLGHSVCASLRPDGNPQAWFQRTTDMQLTDGDRVAITDAAINQFCPQYRGV